MNRAETWRDTVAAAIARLRAAGIDDPARDARRLLAHVMGIEPGRVTLVLGDAAPEAARLRYEAAIVARAAHQPVAQIVGMRAFYGRDFVVTRDVLDPRPETETLIAAALLRPAERILDLGTGSGCILLTLLAEWRNATGIGTDISGPALEVAQRNAARLELSGRATFRQADWADGLSGRFDLVVSNPPYIAADEMAALASDVRDWEPAEALSPGGDGLDAYRRILPQMTALLAPNGRVLVEVGPTQANAVQGLAAAVGLDKATVHRDLDARDRVVEISSSR